MHYQGYMVVNYECEQSGGQPIVITIRSYLAQTHHISVGRIQINVVLGKLWCVHLFHLTTLAYSYSCQSSFANVPPIWELHTILSYTLDITDISKQISPGELAVLLTLETVFNTCRQYKSAKLIVLQCAIIIHKKIFSSKLTVPEALAMGSWSSIKSVFSNGCQGELIMSDLYNSAKIWPT